MRILKCYLANNTRNQFVNAKKADKAGDDEGYWGTGRVPVAVAS